MNFLKIKQKILPLCKFERFNTKYCTRITLKNFSIYIQNENVRTVKNSSSESIEDIMGNSQDSNFRNSMMNNQMQNFLPKKRQRLSFLRDGMIISFYLRKDRNSEKDPRFLVAKSISLAKLLLLNPKSFCQLDKLEKITINQKFRILDIHQTSDNKYTFTLKVISKMDSQTNEINQTNLDSNSKSIVSHIELNPEDIIVLQKFINKCLDELLNF